MEEKKNFFMHYYCLRNEDTCFSLLQFFVDGGFLDDLTCKFFLVKEKM